MELNHYPYHFVQRFDEYCALGEQFLKYKWLYAFKSPKSHQWYWAWVEVYDNHFYEIKFHLKVHKDSENKYSFMTGLHEARQVINTCMCIMMEIAKKDPRSSFGFIGANMAGESTIFTKRFKVYSRIVATYFSDEHFEHTMNIEKSAYMLVRRSEIEANPDLVSQLNQKFKILYDYFE